MQTRWNDEAQPESIESLEDFTVRCCGSVVCGPHLRGLCCRSGLEVHDLVSESAWRKHLESRRERRERLDELLGEESPLPGDAPAAAGS